MNRSILNERLVALIQSFAQGSMEARQVAKRLYALLPARFADLKRKHGGGSARAERLALTDPRYLQSVDEYVAIQGEALRSRIQYETHAMLFKARQSLKGARR